MKILTVSDFKGIRQLQSEGHFSLSFHSADLNDNEILELLKSKGQTVCLYFTDQNIVSEEAQKEILKIKLKPNEKWTPGQELRFECEKTARLRGMTNREDIEQYYRNRVNHFKALEQAIQ